MNLTINTYAILKEYFEPRFELQIENEFTIDALKKELTNLKPEASGIINSCRFAIRDSFIDDNTILKEKNDVHIIPPSSGG